MTTTFDTEWGQAFLPSRLIQEAQRTNAGEEYDEIEVAICGGGLAGLTVAIGLHRANIPCKIYERAPKLRTNSQGILAVQPNGMKALGQIHPSLPSMIAKAGCEREQLVITKIHADGNEEETFHETGQEALHKYGRKKVGLTWHKMQQVLASLLPPEIVETNRSLVSFQENDDSILLHLEDSHGGGSPVRKTIRAKAVVACDGTFSAARRQMFQSEDDPPLYFGQLNWATVIETKKLPPNVHPENAVHYFMNEGEPRWMSMINDGGGGQSFWQFRVADPDMALKLSINNGRGGLGLPGVKDALLPVAKPCALVYKTIECIPEAQIFERSIVGRNPATTWLSEKGRLALVGDSAHAMHPNIAQGFNSAAESSCAIGKAMVDEFRNCKEKDSVNWKAAFKAYEQNRKPRADIVQRWANMMGCYQATGQTVVSKEIVNDVMDWIVGEDPKKYPSKETMNMIFAFDPLSQRGVSRIT